MNPLRSPTGRRRGIPVVARRRARRSHQPQQQQRKPKAPAALVMDGTIERLAWASLRSDRDHQGRKNRRGREQAVSDWVATRRATGKRVNAQTATSSQKAMSRKKKRRTKTTLVLSEAIRKTRAREEGQRRGSDLTDLTGTRTQQHEQLKSPTYGR